MQLKNTHPTRRRLLGAASATSIAASGCLRLIGSSNSTETPSSPSDAQFDFQYDEDAKALEITYEAGVPLVAEQLQIRSSDGEVATWNELGSTSTTGSETVTPGDSARIAAKVFNWGSSIATDETVRIMFIAEDGSPTTLAIFDPTNTDNGAPRATETDDQQSAVGGIWEDFEEYSDGETPEGWSGDTGPWEADTSTAAAGSNVSGRLPFSSATDRIRYEFSNRKRPSEIFFWFKAERYDDQLLFIDIIDSENSAVAMRIKTGQSSGCSNCPVILANTGRNPSAEDQIILTDSPTADEWYRVRFHSIDWDAKSCDVELSDSTEQVVASESRIPFYDSAAEAYDEFDIDNNMNVYSVTAWVDNIGDT